MENLFRKITENIWFWYITALVLSLVSKNPA